MRRRTRSIVDLGSPLQSENREEHLGETIGESVLCAHEPEPKPQQNPNTY